MPLIIEKEVGKTGKLGIWHIVESLDELLKMKSFSAEDLSIMNAFSHEHRKKEWLGARILLDKLTGNQNTRITYNVHNKPLLQNSAKHISLSHSHSLLTVILDEVETGIDIELVKPKIERIKNKFMCSAELSSLQEEKQEEQLTVYWCAKESLYKLYGKKELAFKENLFIEPFQYSGQGIIRGRIKNAGTDSFFSLRYEKLRSGIDDFMLAYVVPED